MESKPERAGRGVRIGRWGAVAALLGATFLTSAPEAHACDAVHVVERGDTLSAIAFEHYGNMNMFRRIFAANTDTIGSNPNLILIGMKLVLPCIEGTTPKIDLREAKIETEVARTSPAGIRFKLPSRDLSAAAQRSGAIFSAEMLLSAMKGDANLQIVDLAEQRSGTEHVIDGAVSLPFAFWTGVADDDAAMNALLAAAELDLTQQIVLVPGAESYEAMGAAAQIFWALRNAGASKVAVLDAVRQSWPEEGLPVTRLLRVPLNLPEPTGAALRVGDGRDGSPDELTVVEASVIEPTAGAAGGATGEATLPLSDLAVATVGNFKSLDLPWGNVPVHIEARDPSVAALAWFLLAEVAGIEEVHLLAPSADGTLLSSRDEAKKDGTETANAPRLVPGAFSVAREAADEPATTDAVPSIASLDSEPPTPDALAVQRPTARGEPVPLPGLGQSPIGETEGSNGVRVGASTEPTVRPEAPGAFIMSINPVPPADASSALPPGLLTSPPTLETVPAD
ncbi:MAG: hypothetical protein AAF844_11285 [Pseudomonadota bacterium]